MKIKQYILKLILVFGLAVTVSCTGDFDEKNTDPNSFNEAPIDNAFAGVIKETLDLVGGVMNAGMYLNYSSYVGGVGGQTPKFGYSESYVGQIWRTLFVNILKNNEQIIIDHQDDPEYENRVHIAKIWKSYAYSVAVSTWGPLPMTDAFGDNTSVAYDSEEQIYTEILTMLKDAAAGIDPAGDKLSKDPIFNGDNGKWIKFANTLRLKIALRISHGYPTLAEEHGQAAMNNESELIGSNSENATMKWGMDEENWSYFYTKYIFGDPLLDVIPFVNHSFLLHLKTYNDPRMDVIVEDAKEGLSIVDTVYASGSTTVKIAVRYDIPKYGKTLGTRPLDEWDLENNDNIMAGVDAANFSMPSQNIFFSPDAKFNIITDAETKFMKAEAVLKGWGGSSSAESYYNVGIDASFNQYGASGVAAYKEQDGIKWGTSFAGDRDLYGITTSGISANDMDKIIRQRWIAMYWQGHDAWCLLKRTRGIVLPPHLNPDESLVTDLNYAEIPERMLYDTSERSINPEGYAIGMDYLGGFDNTTTPLGMNKPGEFVDWPSLSAEYNQEFANHWYGDSEDDLIANGIPYEKL